VVWWSFWPPVSLGHYILDAGRGAVVPGFCGIRENQAGGGEPWIKGEPDGGADGGFRTGWSETQGPGKV
jgi:hypothetical protein